MIGPIGHKLQKPARSKTGPPPRTDWQAVFLEEIERNCVIGLACKRAGINRSTFDRERRRNPDFAVAYADAHERGLDTLEAILRMRATSGQPIRKTVTKKDGDGKIIEVTESEELLISSTLGMFLTKRYRPEFRESFRVENTGPGGGPIQHEVKVERSLEDFFAELDRLAETSEL